MQSHFELTDQDFSQRFENCTLDPTLFSHEAHLRLAWIHISRFGLERAEANIQGQLRDFVGHLGATDKYHTTVTIAAIKAVNHFMQQSKSDCFGDFILEFPQLKTNFKGLIACHYSFDIFDSAQAKIAFVEPDLVSF